MKKSQILAVGLTLIFSAACQQVSPDEKGFGELALKGKRIFEEQQCSKCHYLGEEKVDAEAAAPDLTDPLIANDSSFIQTHLKFVELSKMPPIELSSEEMRLISHYIAEIHRNKFSTVGESDADARCPVCLAPVSKDQAQNAKLVLRWDRETYYFECEKCKETFKLAPEAILMMLEQDSLAGQQ